MFKGRAVEIAGIGAYAPEKVLSNFDLEKIVETNDEWITTRTGIKERRIASKDMTTSDMMTKAAEIAIKKANIDISQIQLIIGCTVTPDMMFPSSAVLVGKNLGIKHAGAFDIEAACSGFLYGLSIGSQFIASGTMDTILVVAGEKLSSIVNWEDRSTCVLFGDGAGAAVLRPGKEGHGILNFHMEADGNFGEALKMPAGGSAMPASEKTVAEKLHSVKMDGREVFRQAVTKMPESALISINEIGMKIEDIDWFIPHQANIRIIDSAAKKLGIPKEKTIVNLQKYGNTSSASLPLALNEAIEDGTIKDGDTILLTAIGGGLAWGSMILKWGHKE